MKRIKRERTRVDTTFVFKNKGLPFFLCFNFGSFFFFFVNNKIEFVFVKLNNNPVLKCFFLKS